jgi:diguanylate cyclase (GGDEF)-like protein
MGSIEVPIRGVEKKERRMRAHAHGLAGLSRIPEAVVWLAEGEMEDRRSPEAAELLGDLPLLAALRASSLARLRRAMESSRLQAEARRGVELVLRDGRALDATILADEDRMVVVLRDVSRYTVQIDELRQLAERDPLTGLLNRRAFLERGKAELTRGAHTGRPVAVAVVDVDRFARLNDRLGQTTGDAVLAAIARLLSSSRPADVVGRIGGDEFGLVLADTDAAGAVERLERAVRELGSAICVDSTPASFSAGVYLPSADETLEMALYRADGALEGAKEAGRGRVLTA